MNTSDFSPTSQPNAAGNLPAAPLIINAQQVPNALLARLLAEVQHEAPATLTAYNRTHNRHNRGR